MGALITAPSRPARRVPARLPSLECTPVLPLLGPQPRLLRGSFAMPPTRPDAPAWSPGLQTLHCLPSRVPSGGSVGGVGTSHPPWVRDPADHSLHVPRGSCSRWAVGGRHWAAELRQVPDPGLGCTGWLSLYLPLHLSLSVCLFGCPSLSISLCLSLSLSVSLSLPVCLSGSLSLLVCLSPWLFLGLSLCDSLSVSLSPSLLVCLLLSVSLYLLLCLSLWLFLSLCLSISPCVSLFLSPCFSFSLSLSLSFCFSLCLTFPVDLLPFTLCLPVWLFPRVSPSLTVYLSVSLLCQPLPSIRPVVSIRSLGLQGDPTSPS